MMCLFASSRLEVFEMVRFTREDVIQWNPPFLAWYSIE